MYIVRSLTIKTPFLLHKNLPGLILERYIYRYTPRRYGPDHDVYLVRVCLIFHVRDSHLLTQGNVVPLTNKIKRNFSTILVSKENNHRALTCTADVEI